MKINRSIRRLNNEILLFSSQLKDISKGYPVFMNIELTNRCNLNCVTCPRQSMTRKIGDMNLELFEKIINESAGLVRHIRLHFMGEPLFHGELLKIIDLCSTNSIRTILSTNVTLLDETMSKRLLTSGLNQLVLCMDGTTKDTYEKIRVGASFEVTKDNILRFLKKREELGRFGPQIFLNILETKINQHQFLEFKKEWEKFEDLVVGTKLLTDWAGGVPNIESILIKHKDAQSVQIPCDILWTEITILWDGRVVPCCRDFNGTTILGDINRDSIRSMWNSKTMRWIRSQHLRGRQSEVPLCTNCIDWKWYRLSSLPPPYMPIVWWLRHAKNIIIKRKKCNCFWCKRT